MKKLLISACLTGENCKYNGGNNRLENIAELSQKYELIPVCPEKLGGLSTPRAPSERVGNRVINSLDNDVTKEFVAGAKLVLQTAIDNKCDLCLFKERSPSCGVKFIYDGSFSGKIIKGCGITTELLKKHGLDVYSEEELSELI